MFLRHEDFATVVRSTPLISIDLIVENTHGEFLLGKALALPAEPFMTKLFAEKSILDVSLTLLTIFILAPLNEETLFRGIMLNVFRSRYAGRCGWVR